MKWRGLGIGRRLDRWSQPSAGQLNDPFRRLDVLHVGDSSLNADKRKDSGRMTLWEVEERQGSTVLVTGADGFIGSHLVDACLEAGANVHAFVRATSSGTLNNIEHVRDRIPLHEGDVTDMHSVRNALAELDR